MSSFQVITLHGHIGMIPGIGLVGIVNTTGLTPFIAMVIDGLFMAEDTDYHRYLIHGTRFNLKRSLGLGRGLLSWG